jgi:hypothetical protein
MQKVIEDVLYESGVVDIVFSGHVHAYERSCRVYKFECVDDAPYYVTLGDGGNAEGLALPWVEPQPDWSLFRMASYGHAEMTVFNETHAVWQWHVNGDLAVPSVGSSTTSATIGDEFWFVKNSPARPAQKSVTVSPKFNLDTVRGRLGAAFEKKMRRFDH